MTKMILKNDFHGTETTVLTKGGWINERQVARAEKALCGVSGCTCSGSTGMRGHDNPRIAIENPDGSIRLIAE